MHSELRIRGRKAVNRVSKLAVDSMLSKCL